MRKRLAAVLRALAARLDSPMTVASTDFAGSGLTINLYGAKADPGELARQISWCKRGLI